MLRGEESRVGKASLQAGAFGSIKDGDLMGREF